MLTFDRNFTPPAPVADVVVAHPVSSVTSGALRGKLDTGADLTVIPESLVPQLALSARAHCRYAHPPFGVVQERNAPYSDTPLEPQMHEPNRWW